MNHIPRLGEGMYVNGEFVGTIAMVLLSSDVGRDTWKVVNISGATLRITWDPESSQWWIL